MVLRNKFRAADTYSSAHARTHTHMHTTLEGEEGNIKKYIN